MKNKSPPVFKSYGFDMKKMIHCNYTTLERALVLNITEVQVQILRLNSLGHISMEYCLKNCKNLFHLNNHIGTAITRFTFEDLG